MDKMDKDVDMQHILLFSTATSSHFPMLKDCLQQCNCRVDVVDTQAAFLECLQTQQSQIIIIDSNIPSIDCNELLRKVGNSDSADSKIILWAYSSASFSKQLSDKKAVCHENEQLKKLNAKFEDAHKHLLFEHRELRKKLTARTQRLAMSEINYQTLLDNNADAIIVVDQEGIVRFVNPAGENLFLCKKNQLLGKPFGFPVKQETSEVTIANEHRKAIAEMRVEEVFWHGDLVYLASLRDITERKRVEDALQESNRQLETTITELKTMQQQAIRRERLHALGQMASGVAHDVNNALSPILGFSEMLLLRPQALSDHDKVRRYLQLIHAAAQNAAEVVRRMREFYRLGKKEEFSASVNLNAVVKKAIALTQPKWKDQAQAQGVTVEIQEDCGPKCFVAGNEEELLEILTNLIFNAVDAITDNGKIVISSRHIDNYVALVVCDNGTGMPENVRQRCLEPFFTTKTDNSAGLGLSMVYGSVQRHKGELEITSAPNQGTLVKVLLRICEVPTIDIKDIELRVQPVAPMKILVVDDEDVVRQVISEYLQGDGHHVTSAVNGKQALEKLQADNYDLVFTDKAMPQMSGEQLSLLIKELFPAMPIVLLTGFGDLLQSSGKQIPGVDWILSKPVTLDKLRTILAKVLQATQEGAHEEDTHN